MNKLNKLMAWFRGKKTFFVAVLMVILAGLKAEGYLSEETYQVLMGILGALGIASLRLGMMKK